MLFMMTFSNTKISYFLTEIALLKKVTVNFYNFHISILSNAQSILLFLNFCCILRFK